MTVKYYAILTNQGAARLANATMLGSKLNLTQMAVGDANGVLPTPDPAQTKLINQKRIAPLNLLSVDPNNQSQIIAEQIIPENEGGFWIREIGLYDDEGVLIAVANCPETYKPQLQEGSGRTQTIRMILVVTNTEAITLKIDPSVVLATRKYVDDEVLELKLYVDDQMRNHIAAQDPHTQYAQKHNPTFTGEPRAPTPAAGNNTTRIATTEFVQAAITALINGAPATLDTLKEIAAAINNDPKFSTTINNALSGKQPLDETLTHLSGKDVAGLLAYLGIKDASTTQVGLVRLTSSRVSGAEDIAATANAVAQNYTDIKALQNKTQDATTTQKGIVQLTSSRVSESETLAATTKAVALNYADIQALQGKTNDATPTNKGIIRVSDSRTSTESGVAASSLAASQNYSDMKGLFGQCGMKSRNLGVVYTNSQSFAIFVSVNAVLSDGSSFLSANVNVDGNSANFRGSQTTNLAGQRATIAFMVPAGATYIVQQFSGTVSDVTWVEVDKK
ncbi:TPA: phage tail protein [Escherichia coli]|nr:phage tail protein [Escherichia coli]HDW8187147.1 phage tail protein [Escherichia coli]